jgi:hypothetical protein
LQTLRAIADGINAADVLIPVANEQLSVRIESDPRWFAAD